LKRGNFRDTAIRFSIVHRSPSAELNLDQELIRQEGAPRLGSRLEASFDTTRRNRKPI
jgi:hypothetical protein